MPKRIAGIDVHKKEAGRGCWLTSKSKPNIQFERRWYGGNPEQLQVLSEFFGALARSL